MKILNLLLLFFLLFTFSYGQDLQLNWSEKMTFKAKKNGFFKDFIGQNSQFVYSINQTPSVRRASKSTPPMKILFFDKNDFKKKGELILSGFGQGYTDWEVEYKGLVYFYSCVFENKVLIFWKKATKGMQTIYVETFDVELKRLEKLKQVFNLEIDTDLRRSKIFNRFFLKVLTNDKNPNQVVIGAEVQQKDDIALFKYVELDLNLEEKSKGEIRLPGFLTKKSSGQYGSYDLQADGRLYISTYILTDHEEIQAAKKERKRLQRSYCVMTIWDFENNDLITLQLKAEDKNIYDFSYIVSDSGLSIYGFFCDLNKNELGGNIQGVFYINLPAENFEFDALNYSYFTKEQLDELFKNDLSAKAQDSKLTVNKEKKTKRKKIADESIPANNKIEWIYKNERDEVILFFSKMYNYSVQDCSTSSTGQTTCVTRYYCRKSDVTTLKISDKGDFIWGSHIDRSITYSGTDVYDISVASTDENYIVFYGSAYNKVAGKKQQKAKKKSELRDYFEYALIDKSSGDDIVLNFEVNPPKTKRSAIKLVNISNLTVLNNELYLYDVRYKLDLMKSIPFFIGGAAFPPLIFIPILARKNFVKSYGYFGKLSATN